MARTLTNRVESRLVIRFLQSPTLFASCFTISRSLQTLAYEEVRCYGDPSHRLSPLHLLLIGRSTEVEGLNPPHDLVNSAKDLADLVKANGWNWPDVVNGHSLGGKVALQFMESCARGDYGESASPPKQLWVLDSVPGEVKAEQSDGEVEKVLHTLQSLPSPIPSRKWLVDHMVELGFSRSLSEWIGSNLKRSGDSETWAFNLDGAVSKCSTLTENSDRWDHDTTKRLETIANQRQNISEGKVATLLLHNSGHWVHTNNPKGLLEIVSPNFLSTHK